MSYLKGPDVEKALPHFRRSTSVLELLEASLRKSGDATAMVEGQTGKTASFADILQQSTTAAAGLQSAGITAGDYVVLCCDKSISSYSLLLGVMFTGATAVLCPTGKADIIHLMTKGHRVKAAFFHKKYSEPVKTSLNSMDNPPSLIASIDSEDPQMNAIITSKAECIMYKVENPEEHISIILFSSGTTGEPKGIQISDTAVTLMGVLFAPKVETLFNSSPLYWYTGVMTFISPMLNSYTVVMSNATDARENMQLVQKYQADGWFLSIGTMIQCTHVENIESYDCSSIKEVYAGGEMMLKNVMEAFLTKVVGGPAMVQVMYGITEGGIMATTNSDDKALLKTGLQPGLFLHLSPGVEMKILDDDKKPVATGNLGQVWFKCLGLTPGYWSLPELNRQVFDKDGFFCSGDAGFCNHQGRLFHRGRVSDLITYKGVKVAPAEAEELLMSHPAILEAVVIGKAHPTDTHHCTAFVVRRPGSRVKEEEIAAFVNGQVDDMRKLRGGVYFVESLPRIAVGKVIRKVLRT